MDDVSFEPWKYDREPFAITDDTFYIGNKSVSSYLVDSGDGLVLFDTGYPQTTYLLLESIRTLGFSPADIKYIFHSHAHGDHIGSTRKLKEKFGCKTVLGAGDLESLTTRSDLLYYGEMGLEYHDNFDVDIPVSGGDVIPVGKKTVECVAAPGHTRGNMVYIWNASYRGADYRTALLGGFGVNTIRTAYMKKHGITGRRREFKQSLQKLENLKVDIACLGHPVITDPFGRLANKIPGDNPFINANDWRMILSHLSGQFDDLMVNDPE
jgi:metallo-beta-lactamase class B